jgi:hypothetical protein
MQGEPARAPSVWPCCSQLGYPPFGRSATADGAVTLVMSDRAAVMYDGSSSNGETIYRQPVNTFVARSVEWPMIEAPVLGR